MPVTTLAPDGAIDTVRGDTVVCVPVYGALEIFSDCLAALLAHTATDVPIVIADDCGPGDDDPLTLISELIDRIAPERVVHYFRQPRNVGFVENVNTVFRMAAPADVVIVNSDVEVAAGWLEGMLAARATDTRVATVSTLTNHGSILSLPNRNEPAVAPPGDLDVDEAASRVESASLRLYPRIPVAVGHCVLITRSALDLIGPFDLAFSPGYGEEVDFSLRCAQRGLVHVAADDVFVFHRGGASFGGSGHRTQRQHDHDVMVNERYPYFPAWVNWASQAERTPLGRSISIARTSLMPLEVTIDGRCLGPTITGTQIHALELISALHRTGRVRLRVLLPQNVGDYARDALGAMAGLATISEEDILTSGKTDVVHRPYQVGHDREIFDLAHLGRRIVITFQDMIAYNAPSYFPTDDAYFDYIRVTTDIFATADRVVFFSPNAQLEAQRAGLVRDGCTDVVLLGADHEHFKPPVAAQPSQLTNPARPFILCLGTDFAHKNRLFALEVFHVMRAHFGWQGGLVFAGPHVSHGSSRPDEAVFIERNLGTAGHVVDLEAVTESEKAWLLRQSDLVLYPTTVEGFGLVPLEAAEAGTPCMFAPVASLRDVFGDDLATITPWDAETTAATACQLIEDPNAAGRLVEGIRSVAAGLTWDQTADQLIGVYRQAVDNPRPGFGDNAVRAIMREWEIQHLRSEADVASGSAIDRALTHPDAGVPDEVKRATLAVAHRPWLRKAMFGALRASYRIVDARRGRTRADER